MGSEKGRHSLFRVYAIEDLEQEKIIAEIESHFYFLKDDVNMRYFTKEDIICFFADWTSCDAERAQMTRYGTPRETWMLRCQK